MATCGHESGKGRLTLEGLNKDGSTVGSYKKTERGAGYIQITWRETHLEFLESVNDNFTGEDTAAYIAKNYPWEAAGWFWSSVAKTGQGSLNNYVVKYGESKGVYLITQYLVNGWPNALSNDTAILIRDGKVKWSISDGTLYVDGKNTSRAPYGWTDRETNYNDAMKSFK
jgi:hypothetical protein